MNKTAIKNFAVWARNKLIADITYKAGLMGISEDGIKEALPQSTKDMDFYDIGTKEPYSISGAAVRQRGRLADLIYQKAVSSDYKTGYHSVIEEVAYTWFNRLIAIRFMEVNDYLPSHIRVLSSDSTVKLEPDLVTTPFDAELELTEDEKAEVIYLKHENRVDECFRMLFIKQCNALNKILPKLFEKTADYSELLLNVSVTDQDGVVYHLVHDIEEDDFNIEKGGQVEIIGWLYQYYNTEPKDEAFALLKKNVKITKERIPAATQLFTPDWIVRYMVENSLGRLWLEGHPNDDLKACWKYYLDEAEQDADVQVQLDKIREEYKNIKPEDIKVIDPCMGSGHILVYAFDVLMQIYETAGYSQREAAISILENNIYGLDIDDRAFQLAYFAIMMKARQYNHRILNDEIDGHVYSIQASNNINRNQLKYFGTGLSDLEKHDAMNQTNGLLDTFMDAKEYGSILNVETYKWDLLRHFISVNFEDGQMSLDSIGLDAAKEQLQLLIDIGQVMAQKYDVVVTNPPYMVISNGNEKLNEYVKEHYSDSKYDLFAVFIEKCIKLCKNHCYFAMITQHSWMFITSYKKLRQKLLCSDIISMAHLGARAFEEIAGEVVQTVSWVQRKSNLRNYYGLYKRLINYNSQQDKEKAFLTNGNSYLTQKCNFSSVPESPIAYWASKKCIEAFLNDSLEKYVDCKSGIMAGNDDYIKLWFEVEIEKIKFDCKTANDMGNFKWFPLNSGGEYRKWYGNNVKIIDLWNDGFDIKANVKNYRLRDKAYYFKKGITWGRVTTSKIAFREVIDGSLFGDAGPIAFVEKNRLYILGFLCSKVVGYMLNIMNPTLNFQVHDIINIPLEISAENIMKVEKIASDNIEVSKQDWNSFEISSGFMQHPLVIYQHSESQVITENSWYLKKVYETWKYNCQLRFNHLKANEDELNRIFIAIYGLQDELTPEVEDTDVTVRKADLNRDIRGLISYAVGCMFGRYSLEFPGIVYAGGTWDDSKYSSFIPDKDNILLITDEEYFQDDIVGMFCAWLKKVYGTDTLEENMNFIAKALGNKGNTSREVIRNYFLNDFFKDHCCTYSVTGSGKRPIYWLFDSGKQNGFKSLIYMHRYDENTIGNLRIDYLHRMEHIYESEIARMQDTIDKSTNAREVIVATKRNEKLQKQVKECKEYDEKIAHLALARIKIDLDDGVKVNYEKVQTSTDGKKYSVLAKI